MPRREASPTITPPLKGDMHILYSSKSQQLQPQVHTRLQGRFAPLPAAATTLTPCLPPVCPAVPPAKLDTPMDEVLQCPHMRDFLGPPRPNPLLTNLRGVWEGRSAPWAAEH